MPKKLWVGVAVAGVLLVYQFSVFNVLQDDAFISFRYVKNFLVGYGLVFNIGERVEGYTNFFWIMLLALLTKVGLPTIGTARVLGIFFSIGTLAVAAWGADKCYPKRSWLWTVSVPLLLAANGSLAYWAGSGLETGLFTLLTAAAAVFYFFQPALSLIFLTLSALTRPEGALFAFLFGVIGILLKQKSWKATLIYWGALALIMLPYALFKYFYFGSLLPNPFYAKTGFSQEYWQSGLEYGYLFLKHYGLYGTILLLPLLLWKRLTDFSRFCFLVFMGYGFYLVAIGGDVLKAHRFFVPSLMFLYFPFVDSIRQFFGNKHYKWAAFAALVLPFGFYSYRFPLSYLKTSSRLEQGLVGNMSAASRFFADDKTTQSFAVSTIGAFSYSLGQDRVIDMLGLTEPQIARSPEKIEGLTSTWKERHFNASYVLSQKPDVILFSTGFKPSAPAERALFLYPDFRQNYRLDFLFWEGTFRVYYRRFQNRPVGTKPDQPASFVNRFNEGSNQLGIDDERGIALLRRALAQTPKDCGAIYSILGNVYYTVNYLDSAEIYLKKGMELDGGGPLSRFYYRKLLYAQKRFAEAAAQDSILMHSVPYYAELLQATGGALR